MGYAKHIGRVGALAVTLGVGLAIGSTPAIANADESGPSVTADSPSPNSEKPQTPAPLKDPSLKEVASPGPRHSWRPKRGLTDATTSDNDSSWRSRHSLPKKEKEARAGDDAAEKPAVVESVKDDTLVDAPSKRKDDSTRDVDRRDSAGPRVSAPRLVHPRAVTLPRPPRDVESTVTPVIREGLRAVGELKKDLGLAKATETVARYSSTPKLTDSRMIAAAVEAPVAPAVAQQRPVLIGVLRAVLRPLLNPGTESPLQLPVVTALLAAVRNEFERNTLRRSVNPATQQSIAELVDPPTPVSTLAVDTTPHVLVIGVDGTNLKNILADPENENFFELMDNSTTAASTIVGHTTISNPSWTTILTGVWGETAGVSNNVFVPSVYDTYPTVFNQLEAHDPTIQTTVIADWEGTAAIGQAGLHPADTVLFVPQIVGDTNWLATDDKVGALSVEAIKNTVVGDPSLQFTYFVGVDNNGHMYGADSPEYKAAIENVDDNLGAILHEVALREAAGEDWTVIVVTDHGMVGPHTLLDRGHGFQSPAETTTFVIADIAGDTCDGCMNNAYRIVDMTPTVLDLFGLPQQSYFEGVPLRDRSASTTVPVDLHQALNDAIDMYGYPDIITNVALTVRTVATIVPYYVYDLKHSTTVQLQGIVDQNIPLVSPLAAVAMVPVVIFFDGLYVATNVPAQIVARVTGVTGASIFPLFPPAWPTFPPLPPEQTFAPDLILAGCGDGRLLVARCTAV